MNKPIGDRSMKVREGGRAFSRGVYFRGRMLTKAIGALLRNSR